MGMQHGLSPRKCSKNMQHGNKAWTSEICCVDMQYGEAHGCGLDMQLWNTLDMQQRRTARTCSIDMQEGHAAWTCNKDMQNEHAAWKYRVDICSTDMQCRHAARTWSTDMQHGHAPRTCCSETRKICSANYNLSSYLMWKSANFLFVR